MVQGDKCMVRYEVRSKKQWYRVPGAECEADKHFVLRTSYSPSSVFLTLTPAP
jgi:hypothetical protein